MNHSCIVIKICTQAAHVNSAKNDENHTWFEEIEIQD